MVNGLLPLLDPLRGSNAWAVAFKLLLAVFDNTKHEKAEGEYYKDVEEFYGWELS